MEKCKKTTLKSSVFVLLAVCVFMCTTLSLVLPKDVNAAVSVNPKISCGYDHTLALKYDGTVYAWGYNASGQLGNGTLSYSNVPVKVQTGVVDIAAGGSHSLVLKNDGTISAWGSNDYGQLGNTKGLTGVIAIAAGEDFSMALKNDGTVWAWGRNDYGQLGDGTCIQSNNPVQVKGLTGITAIDCGEGHALALKNDGTVWAWGNNSSGQLGNGTSTSSSIPVQVISAPHVIVTSAPKLNGVTSISAGGNNSTALQDKGTLWTWGSNTYGQSGVHISNEAVPEKVDTNSFFYSKVSCGMNFTLLVDDSQSLSSKGINKYGQLGIGTNTNTSQETSIALYDDAVDVSAACFHGVCLMSDGSVWSWGRNDFGQLGDGTNINKNKPVLVKNLTLVDLSVPAAPTQLAAKAGNQKVSLSWNASQGTAYYSVKRATTAGGPYSSITSKLTSTTFEDNAVENNTRYYYIVTATSSSGIESLASSEVSATPYIPIAPSKPTELIAYAGTNKVELFWYSGSDAVSYNLKRATSAGGPYTTIKSGIWYRNYIDTMVNNGTEYYYIVTAISRDGLESLPSTEVSATPIAPVPPSSPTGLTAAAGDNKVSLSWGAVTEAATYSVKRATMPGGPYSSVATNITTTAYEDTTVTNGISYYYVVTATSSSGLESAASSEITVVPSKPAAPTAPTNLKITSGDRFISLTWDASPSTPTPTYTVKTSTSLNGPYETHVSQWPATKLTTEGLANDITYYYYVIAENINGMSGPSNIVSATPMSTTPLAPKNLAAVVNSDGKVELSFSTSLGAAYYTIKRSTTAGGPYSTITTNLTTTTFQDTAVTPGAIYYYIVTATSGAGKESLASNEVSANMEVIAPLPPTNIQAIAGNGTISYRWELSPSTPAPKYTVKRSTSLDGPYETVVTNWNANSLYSNGVTNNITYYTIIIAENINGTSVPSNPVAATPMAPASATPTGLVSVAGDGKVDISFNASQEAAYYSIKRATTAGGPYTKITINLTTTSYQDTTVINGIKYYYIVTATSSLGGESSASNEVSATPMALPTNPLAPLTPTNIQVSAGDGLISLKWDPSPSTPAPTYTVKRSTSPDGPYETIVTGWTGTSMNTAGFTNNITYYLIVLAENINGTSQPSDAVAATPMAPVISIPANLVAAAGDGKVGLSFSSSQGAAYYSIKRATTAGGPYTNVITNLTTTSYQDTTVTNETMYYYIVTATSSTGEESLASNEVTAIPTVSPLAPLAPTSLQVSINNGSIRLKWDPSSSTPTPSYTIKRSTTQGGPYNTLFTNIMNPYSTIYESDTTTYYYVVTAENSNGTSEPSNEVSAAQTAATEY